MECKHNEIIRTIIGTIENRMKLNHITLNIGEELGCGLKCNQCSNCTKQSEKDERTILAYLDSQSKIPSAVPRTIHKSSSYTSSQSALPNDVKQILTDFESKISTGVSLKFNLSRQIFNASKKDVILNSWGITHIHLSSVEVTSKNGMKRNRANYLLLCIFDEKDAYLIDVIPHPTEASDFACIDYLRIIYHEGWLSEIGYREDKNAVLCFPDVTNDIDLYNCISRANLLFSFEGHVFCCMNGVVCTGHKRLHVRRMYESFNYIRDLLNKCQSCEYISPDEMNNDLGMLKLVIDEQIVQIKITSDLNFEGC